jgi:hypothetical protein
LFQIPWGRLEEGLSAPQGWRMPLGSRCWPAPRLIRTRPPPPVGGCTLREILRPFECHFVDFGSGRPAEARYRPRAPNIFRGTPSNFRVCQLQVPSGNRAREDSGRSHPYMPTAPRPSSSQHVGPRALRRLHRSGKSQAEVSPRLQNWTQANSQLAAPSPPPGGPRFPPGRLMA